MYVDVDPLRFWGKVYVELSLLRQLDFVEHFGAGFVEAFVSRIAVDEPAL